MAASTITLGRTNFQQFTNNTFSHLSADQDFTDVTLACDDGQLVKAHKVILAAASPFFKRILCQAAHPNPLVHIQGVKIGHLKLMLDFIYLGRAGVDSDDLEDFFETSRRLHIEGVEEVLEEECRGEKNMVEKKNMVEEGELEKREGAEENVKMCEETLEEEMQTPRESVIVFSQQAPCLEETETEMSEQALEMETTGRDGFVNKITTKSDKQLQENMDEQNFDEQLNEGDLIEKNKQIEKENDEQSSKDETETDVKHEKMDLAENLLYEEKGDHEQSLNLDDDEKSDGQVGRENEEERDVGEEVKEEESEEIEEDLSDLDQWGYARPLNLTFLPDPEQILDFQEASGEVAAVDVVEVDGEVDLADLDQSNQVDLVNLCNQVDLVDQLREQETKLERKYNLRNRRESNTSNKVGSCKSKKKGKKSDLEPKKVAGIEINPFHDESAFEDSGKKIKHVKEAKALSLVTKKQVSVQYNSAATRKTRTGAHSLDQNILSSSRSNLNSLSSSRSSLPRRRTRSSSKALQVFQFFCPGGNIGIHWNTKDLNIVSRTISLFFRKMLLLKNLSR